MGPIYHFVNFRGSQDKMDWMYKKDRPENEDYLLGRRIDKHIEEAEHVEEEQNKGRRISRRIYELTIEIFCKFSFSWNHYSDDPIRSQIYYAYHVIRWLHLSDFTAYVDYMDLAVCCLRKAVKLNHSLTVKFQWSDNYRHKCHGFETVTSIS